MQRLLDTSTVQAFEKARIDPPAAKLLPVFAERPACGDSPKRYAANHRRINRYNRGRSQEFIGRLIRISKASECLK